MFLPVTIFSCFLLKKWRLKKRVKIRSVTVVKEILTDNPGKFYMSTWNFGFPIWFPISGFPFGFVRFPISFPIPDFRFGISDFISGFQRFPRQTYYVYMYIYIYIYICILYIAAKYTYNYCRKYVFYYIYHKYIYIYIYVI